MKIPKRLKRNPIIDAVAEVRFTSSLPSEVIIGVVYDNVKDKFGQPKPLPIMQLPAELREKDPNLRYQACYRFEKPGNVLLVGSHNVALSTIPYTDWAAVIPLLTDLLATFEHIKLFQSVERIGLRYINFFEKLNIFEHSTLSIEVKNQSIAAQSIVLRTETAIEGFNVITSVSNTAQAVLAGEAKEGSILDLDIAKDSPEFHGEPLPNALLRLFTDANKLADDAFFGLINQELVAKFEPEY